MAKLNYNELVDVLSKETAVSKTQIKTIFETLGEILPKYEEIRLPFGKFQLKTVSERKGRNPQTGEEITIPAHKKVVFKPFKPLNRLPID